MADTRQFAFLIPELDFLAATKLTGENGNIRDRVSRLMKSGKIQGVVPGIYISSVEFRRRPVSLEILANKIYGPSYVSFEYVLARAGLIPAELAERVAEAYRVLRRRQHALRLQGAEKARLPSDQLVAERAAVRELWDRVIGGA